MLAHALRIGSLTLLAAASCSSESDDAAGSSSSAAATTSSSASTSTSSGAGTGGDGGTGAMGASSSTQASSSSTASSSGAGGTGGSASSAGGAGGAAATPYQPCKTEVCEALFPQCQNSTANDHTFCTIPCVDAGDCPAAPSGTAEPTCHPTFHRCVLACAADPECPAGMDCVDVFGVTACGWP